jgi:aminobenzoyl-glutamate utilization protein B
MFRCSSALRPAALAALITALGATAPLAAQPGGPTWADSIKYKYPGDARAARLKAEAVKGVEARAKMVQEIIDMVFSFGELGMQEVETSKYLSGLLEQNGFTVQRGVAGMPTAWIARWSNGSGKPVISLGSDIDGIPQSNQAPAVAYREWQVTGAPGHGEGHNSGQAVNIVAAIAMKELMQKENLSGTLVLWPGVAEEQVAAKAHYIRSGVLKDVDVTLFTHVGDDLGVSWGQSGSNAIISAEFFFKGQSAHAAGAPWRGKSALDAVMLMASGWEFRREHLELPQRSHYVIKDGGDQPNVVPSTASIWFYFRERDYARTKNLFDIGRRIADGAAMMTDTKLDTVRIWGSAWSGHFSRPVAEAMYENIRKVGVPTWDANDQALARGLQKELGVADSGLRTGIGRLTGPVPPERRTGGGSDDIGDISWNMPTITLRYPSNIPNLPGHNWANGIAMATPIAHKGGVAGAKVQAMTLVDLFTSPKLVADAWDWFRTVQTKDEKYVSFLGPGDTPPTFLNADIMAKYREQMRKFYYDPKKYPTYLEQLGIKYPTVREPKKVIQ